MSFAYRAAFAIGYYGLVLLWTAALGAASPVLYGVFRGFRKMAPGRAIREVIWVYGRGWSKIFAAFTPTEYGDPGVEIPLPCIFIANHQSFFDAYFMGALEYPDVVFVVREWPFKIPFYGFFMRKAEYINAETMDAEEFIEAGRRILQSGASVVVFPEGTRSRTAEMGRFRSGAFVLSLATNTPIVPICLDGTGDFLRRGDFLPSKTTVRVTMLEPLFPEAYAPLGEGAHSALRREAKARLRKTLEQSPRRAL